MLNPAMARVHIPGRAATLNLPGHVSTRRTPLQLTRRRETRIDSWFSKLRPSSEDAGIYGSQGRDDYDKDDVEQYFNYMGMLATEGTYDRLEETLQSELHPIDILLLWASTENDDPKVQELLNAGADYTVRDKDGNTPLSLTTSQEVKEILQTAGAQE